MRRNLGDCSVHNPDSTRTPQSVKVNLKYKNTYFPKIKQILKSRLM